MAHACADALAVEVKAMEIGGYIRKLRQKMNISQPKFAKLVGASASAICKWESGTNIPDCQHAQTLKQIYFVYFPQERGIVDVFDTLSTDPAQLSVEVQYTKNEVKAELVLNKFSHYMIELAQDLFKDPAVQAEFAAWQAKRKTKEAAVYGEN